MPAIRFRDLRIWESENWRFFAGSPVGNVYGEPGWLCQDQTTGDLYVHGAGNNLTGWNKVATNSVLESQQGEIAIQNGVQSYALVFPTPFSVAPALVLPSIALVGPGGAGELFIVGYDKSTLTANGVTFWLSDVPTAASVGSFINWLARA